MRPTSGKAVMLTRRRRPSGNRPTWPHMLEASTASVPGPRMNRSPDVMDALAGSLDNLLLAATSDKTTLQQVTAANIAITTTVSTLTVANKKLTKTVAQFNLPPNLHGGYAGRGSEGDQRNAPRAIWGNYCWTHGYKTAHNYAACVTAH